MIFYDYENPAGIQRVIANLSSTFVENGHSVDLLVSRKPPQPPFPLPPNVRLHTHSLPEPEGRGLLRMLGHIFWFVSAFLKINLFLRGRTYDTIIDHGTSLGLFYPFRRFKNIPFVLLRHFGIRSFPKGPKLYALISFFGRSKNVVVLARSYEDELRELGFKHVFCIPNPIVSRPIACDSRSGQPFILAVGRPNPQKGFDLLANAFIKAKIWEQYQIRLRIIGPSVPDLLPSLIKTPAKQLLSSGIDLFDAKANIDLLMRSALFLVAPSRYEGVPMVIVEALSHGKAIVASDIDGVNSIVHNGHNGLLFESCNVNALAASLLSLVDDAILLAKLESNARDSVIAYSPEAVMAKWQACVEACRHER